MHRSNCLVLFVATVVLLPAAAQTVYRCGNQYSQQRCPGAKAIDVDDSRTPQQKAQTDAAAAQAARAAEQMERDRLAMERRLRTEIAANSKKAGAAGTASVPAASDGGKIKTRAENKSRKPEPDLFVASSGTAAKKAGEAKTGKK